MTTPTNIKAIVANETAALAPTLYDAVAFGLSDARTRLTGLDLKKYPAQLSGLVRVGVREDLETRHLPGGWQVTGDPRKMAELILENTEHNVSLRFLKENRANPGRVPHAGANQARRRAWADTDTPLLTGLDWAASAATSGQYSCLLLWGPVDPSQLDMGFTLRVVHTVEPGVYRNQVLCDMEIELLQGGTISDRLKFTGSDEPGDLFFTANLANDADGD